MSETWFQAFHRFSREFKNIDSISPSLAQYFTMYWIGRYSYCSKHTFHAHASNGWKSFQACFLPNSMLLWHTFFFSEVIDIDTTNANSFFERQEKQSLIDWNVIMQDVTDGVPGHDINATLIKDLLQKHYQDLKESKV